MLLIRVGSKGVALTPDASDTSCLKMRSGKTNCLQSNSAETSCPNDTTFFTISTTEVSCLFKLAQKKSTELLY